jgi:hypothetical protein
VVIEEKKRKEKKDGRIGYPESQPSKAHKPEYRAEARSLDEVDEFLKTLSGRKLADCW